MGDRTVFISTTESIRLCSSNQCSVFGGAGVGYVDNVIRKEVKIINMHESTANKVCVTGYQGHSKIQKYQSIQRIRS